MIRSTRDPMRRGLNVHLYPSPLTHEMRMEKLAASIAGTGAFSAIELVGVQGEGLAAREERTGFSLVRIPRGDFGGPRVLRKAAATLDWSRRVLLRYARADLACVNSHSLAVLPLGVLLKLATGARLVYDTHELETEVSTSRGIVRAVYKTLEAALVRFADEIVVVSDSIADWYRDTYGLRRPWVVRNVPAVPAGGLPAPDPRLWRDRFGIPDDHLVFIYQGGLFRGRRVEQFLRVFAAARRDRHVVFMGYGELEEEVRAAAARHPNIHFAPAVKPSDVLRHTAGADVGLVGVENVCLSYYYSLPNKLFEYLLAGIPAVMPGYPEMALVLRRNRVGWLAEESDRSWLEIVDGLSHGDMALCRSAARAAAESCSWDREAAPLCSAYVTGFARPASRMRTCLHVFLTPARQESRFLREAGAQVASGLFDEVVLAAKWEPGLPEEETLAPGIRVWRVRLTTGPLPRTLPMQLLKMAEWRARIVALAKRLRPELVVAHSLAALPVGLACKRATGAPLLYDAHELETERNGLRGWRKGLERRTERRLIRGCDAVVVVSDSIADWYAREYGIVRPTVVRNVPEVTGEPPRPDPRLWRDRFGIPDDHLVFIYQGGLFRGRRIEQFLRVFAAARPDRHVVFMGYGELEGLVRDAAARHANIHFVPAVPPRDVLRHTAGADVGLVGVENVCLSYYYSLPNKLFEYLFAGIPALAPDYPEIASLVLRTKCGAVVREDDSSWIHAVNGHTREPNRIVDQGSRGVNLAGEFSGEMAKFEHVVRGVLPGQLAIGRVRE